LLSKKALRLTLFKMKSAYGTAGMDDKSVKDFASPHISWMSFFIPKWSTARIAEDHFTVLAPFRRTFPYSGRTSPIAPVFLYTPGQRSSLRSVGSKARSHCCKQALEWITAAQ
jgi:hypothetical protein